MKTFGRVLLPLLLLAGTAAAQQQQFATLQKGFQADKLYHFADIDHVNIFNGNLIIAMPVSLGYPLNGGLLYQLQLSYNSKSWDFESISGLGVVRARPTKRSNAGFGWLMGLGRLIPADDYVRNSTMKPVYEAPDGADHIFDDAGRTSDGSNLRLRSVGSDKEIDFPDGTVRRFSNVSGTDWELREIRAAGPTGTPDKVTIDRTTDKSHCTADPNVVSMVWWISDSRARNHYVCFQSFDVDGDQWPMVTEIVLDGPQGSVARYTFTYDAHVTVAKPMGDTDGDWTRWRQDHTVPLLRSLLLPDESQYQFSYASSAGGPILSVTLPTMGKIQYGYQEYRIPSLEKCASNYGLTYGFGASTFGIGTRTFLPAGQNPVPRVWTYQTSLSDPYVAVEDCTPPGPNNPSGASTHPDLHEMYTVKVIDPAGNVVSNFFSVWPGDAGRLPDSNISPSGFQRRYYGYPYGPYDATQNRWLSQAYQDSSLTLRRSMFVRHDVKPIPGQPEGNPEAPHRLASQRTVFNDDPIDATHAHYTESDSTDWDDYGHYRTVTTGGSFGAHPYRKRTVTTSWNKLSGVARIFAGSDKWILNAYESVTTMEEDAGTFVEQACFDLATGFLKARRQLAASVPATNDLLTVLEVGTDGNLQREKYYGGDVTPLPTGANQTYLCSALSSLAGATPAYEITHTWQSGQIATSKYSGIPYFSMDLTIDRSGLITKSRDTAGLETSYDYNSSGLLTALRSPGVLATTITYDNASLNNGLLTRAKATQVTGSGEQELKTIYEFDSFGRVELQKQKMPSDPNNPQAEKWSAQQTVYDALGRKSSESALEAFAGSTFNPAHKTEYLNYDPFGRAGKIKAPDGNELSFVYSGARKVERISSGGGNVAIPEMRNCEFRDPFGRLDQVQEDCRQPSTLATTEYSYDAADRLAAVRMSTAGAVQSRYFSYDGRGFLIWESQPESGMKSYKYDARGHIRSVEVGAANTMFDLKLTYDTAERLQKVEARDPANPNVYRIFKEFAYGTANDTASSPADYRRGKLLTATRYNYKPEAVSSGFPFSTVRVTETYGYKDDAGRKTDRRTEIADNFNNSGLWLTAKAVTQSVTYDSMGMPQKVRYPLCEDCGAPPGLGQDLTSSYTHGRIASVQSFVDSISYWPNGMRNVLRHSNGIADTQQPDTFGMPRPASLKSEVYKPCLAPVITSQTQGVVRSTSQTSVRLEVSATGSIPLSYSWYNSTNPESPVLIGTGLPYIDVSPTSTTTYYATVGNDCRTTRSKTITVKYGDCVVPWINEATATRNSDGSFTLSVSASGTGTLSYAWRRLPDNLGVGSTATVTTGILTSSTTFQITVTTDTNSCGGSGATMTVQASVPKSVTSMLLNAVQVASNQIKVEWSAVSGATSYYLYRRDGTIWQDPISISASTTIYLDSNLPLNKAFAYRVEATAGNEAIGQTNVEVGSTLQFTPVVAFQTEVSANLFDELLRGVNAVRALSGWTSLVWSNILAPTDSLPEPGKLVLSRHLLAIRVRLNEALQALGASIGGYTDSDVQGALIKANYINEIHTRLK